MGRAAGGRLCRRSGGTAPPYPGRHVDTNGYSPAPPRRRDTRPLAPPSGGYPAAPGYSSPPAGKTSTLAIVALISAIVGFVLIPVIPSVVAVITGHIALGQVKKTGEQGRGLALAGTIVGWVGVGL